MTIRGSCICFNVLVDKFLEGKDLSLIFFFFKTLFFQSNFRFTTKLRGR